MNKNSILKIFLALSIIFISLAFIGCSENTKVKNHKPIVSLSTFVLHDMASHIAGDTIELIKIIPAGVDIHSYEPTPKVMSKIEKSDIVMANGAGLEPWLHSFKFKSKFIAFAKYLKLKGLAQSDHHDHEHHGGQCSHSVYDPHIWFDIDKMKKIVDIMTYEFITLQPKHKMLYLENRDSYVKTLENLNTLYKKQLGSCKLKTIVTDHNAFSYLASNYGFEIKTLSGISPEAEVSPKDIIRVTKDVKKYNVPVVFFENFTSDKAMKSLATEANVEVDSLHPLGNITKDDVKNNATYEDIMKQNLSKISKALICQ